MVSRGRARVPRVRLAARQGLLVLPAGRLLPVDQRLPEQRVEPPHAARGRGRPGLEPDPVRVGVQDRGGYLGRDVGLRLRAAAQVDGELAGLGGGSSGTAGPGDGVVGGEDRADHRGLAEIGPVLDPVADDADGGQVGVRPAQGLDDRPHRRLSAGRAAQPRRRPYVDLHRQPPIRTTPGICIPGAFVAGRRTNSPEFARIFIAPVLRPLYSHADIVGAHRSLGRFRASLTPSCCPSGCAATSAGRTSLAGEGLCGCTNGEPLPRAVMATAYPLVKSGAYGAFFGVKTGGAPAAGDADPAIGLAA